MYIRPLNTSDRTLLAKNLALFTRGAFCEQKERQCARETPERAPDSFTCFALRVDSRALLHIVGWKHTDMAVDLAPRSALKENG